MRAEESVFSKDEPYWKGFESHVVSYIYTYIHCVCVYLQVQYLSELILNYYLILITEMFMIWEGIQGRWEKEKSGNDVKSGCKQ